MATSKETRPTPQSLPKLTIPAGLYEQEPEEITASRAEEFLEYCCENKRAPITRLPSIPLAPAADLESDTNPSGKETEWESNLESCPTSRTCVDSTDLDTLAFTANECDDLDAKEAELNEAKAQHTEWYTELLAFPKDRNAILKCRHFRLARERLNKEIALIYERREIRRKFRQDFNNVEGLENW
ncbi:hypothetical protein F4818DRAFT_204440 [Hypoxylon cercidicola]|nr:hypothetical protein F4818DRAFT_204440 [Hypoxylon cercidicola]